MKETKSLSKQKIKAFIFFAVCLLIILIVVGMILPLHNNILSLIYMIAAVAAELLLPFKLVQISLSGEEEEPEMKIFKGFGIAALILLLLGIIYSVRYPSVIKDFKDGRTMTIHLVMDEEYSSGYVFGSLKEHQEYLIINGKRYNNGSYVRLKVGEKYSCTAGFEVVTGKTSSTAREYVSDMSMAFVNGEDSGETDLSLQLTPGQNAFEETECTVKGKYLQADMKIDLIPAPGFFAVIFHF